MIFSFRVDWASFWIDWAPFRVYWASFRVYWASFRVYWASFWFNTFTGHFTVYLRLIVYYISEKM